jgi:hypothetical protein
MVLRGGDAVMQILTECDVALPEFNLLLEAPGNFSDVAFEIRVTKSLPKDCDLAVCIAESKDDAKDVARWFSRVRNRNSVCVCVCPEELVRDWANVRVISPRPFNASVIAEELRMAICEPLLRALGFTVR